ncbi:MAG: lysophospholipid acyltransferase family protein, partial [Ktedonobacteraceae bacterium]
MQEHQSPSTISTQQTQIASSTPQIKERKQTKNLYEPYTMPKWFWMTLTVIIRSILSLFLNITLIGEKDVPREGPFIIAANHLDWTDIPLIPAYLSLQMIYIAKEELFMGKLGWLVRFMGAIPVKRGEADRQLLRAADDLLKRGKIITIFPEGTRSKTQKMNSAHAGLGMIALRANVPVIPIAIYGSENAFKKFRPRVTITYG